MSVPAVEEVATPPSFKPADGRVGSCCDVVDLWFRTRRRRVVQSLMRTPHRIASEPRGTGLVALRALAVAQGALLFEASALGLRHTLSLADLHLESGTTVVLIAAVWSSFLAAVGVALIVLAIRLTASRPGRRLAVIEVMVVVIAVVLLAAHGLVDDPFALVLLASAGVARWLWRSSMVSPATH